MNDARKAEVLRRLAYILEEAWEDCFHFLPDSQMYVDVLFEAAARLEEMEEIEEEP